MLGMAALLLESAWICDDAFITLRTVDNFLNGRGLTWNIAERVQAFTHPLWLFLISSTIALSREFYFTTLGVSFVLTLITVYVMAKHLAASSWNALVAIAILGSSKAFVDYSISGLENPLSLAILTGFVHLSIKGEKTPHHLKWLGLLAGAAMLTRLDLGLIVVPSLIYISFKQPSRATYLDLATGLLPVALWELFSLLYYGFPFPNTAYAKMNTGIPRVDLIQQGFHYLAHSLGHDPLTPVTIVFGSIWYLRRGAAERALTLGAVFYLLYVVTIGGDFMAGRFLTAPLLVVVGLIAASNEKVWTHRAMLMCAIASFIFLRATAGASTFETIDVHGIADERRVYAEQTGLIETWPAGPDLSPNDIHSESGVAYTGNVGISGLRADPATHILDAFALGDPLLARLPVRSPNWRIGHFIRDIPAGYLDDDRDEIQNAKIAEYHRRLSRLTRDPLFSLGRIREIFRFLFGINDGLLAELFEAQHLEYQAIAELSNGDLEASIITLHRAVELDTGRSNAWYLLSEALRSDGRFKEAGESLRNVFALLPENAAIDDRYRVGFLSILSGLLESHHHQEASVITHKISEVVPQFPSAHLFGGLLSLRAGETQQGQVSILRAIRLDPRIQDSLDDRLSALGLDRLAVPQVSRALPFDPTSGIAWMQLAEAFSELGAPIEAAESGLEVYGRTTERAPVRVLLTNVCQKLANTGRLDLAAIVFEQMILLDPEYAIAHLNLGKIYVAQGNLDNATALYTRATQLIPEDDRIRAARLEVETLISNRDAGSP